MDKAIEIKDSPRLSDLAVKLGYALIAASLIGFAGVAWATAMRGGDKADEAIKMVNEDRQRLARIETQFEGINYRLDEIKTLIKYKIPER